MFLLFFTVRCNYFAMYASQMLRSRWLPIGVAASISMTPKPLPIACPNSSDLILTVLNQIAVSPTRQLLSVRRIVLTYKLSVVLGLIIATSNKAVDWHYMATYYEWGQFGASFASLRIYTCSSLSISNSSHNAIQAVMCNFLRMLCRLMLPPSSFHVAFWIDDHVITCRTFACAVCLFYDARLYCNGGYCF